MISFFNHSNPYVLGSTPKPLPAGIIFLFNDTSVPDGWTRLTGYDNKFILGTPSTGSALTTGGSLSISPSFSTNSNGAHIGTEDHGIYYWTSGGYDPAYAGVSAISGGNHTHNITGADGLLNPWEDMIHHKPYQVLNMLMRYSVLYPWKKVP